MITFDIQAQLKVGKADDVYKQEADRTAEKVMRIPDSEAQQKEEKVVQSKPILDKITPIVQRKTEEEEIVQAQSENEISLHRQEKETVKE